MPLKNFKSTLSTNLIIRASIVSVMLALITFAAPQSLGTSDVPSLPAGDGSGDVPDMFIKLVPGVSATGTTGTKGSGEMRLSTLRGKVTLIDMFWSKCHVCEDHAPHVVELYNLYRQRGLNVLGLATDPQDKIDDVKAFMRKAKISYPVGFVTTEIIAYYSDDKQRGVPQMVLFGADGKMVKRLVGWDEGKNKELKEAIEAQFAKTPTVKPGSKASSKPSPTSIKQG
jgi:glutathione peroxidase-family protein